MLDKESLFYLLSDVNTFIEVGTAPTNLDKKVVFYSQNRESSKFVREPDSGFY
jgi:hypothetical protein